MPDMSGSQPLPEGRVMAKSVENERDSESGRMIAGVVSQTLGGVYLYQVSPAGGQGFSASNTWDNWVNTPRIARGCSQMLLNPRLV